MREPTALALSAGASVLDEAVLQLPWLAPGAASLLSLCRSSTATLWNQVRHDPGLVLLLARQPLPDAASRFDLLTAAEQPNLLGDIALQLQQLPCGVVNWHEEPARTILAASHACAHLAAELARRSGLAQPEPAWVCGLLAPLGWLLFAAVDPGGAEQALKTRQATPLLPSLARRLARAWNLPDWLSAVVGFLGVPERVACSLGANPVLFHLTRVAVDLARGQGHDLGLVAPARASESSQVLPANMLTGSWIDETCREAAAHGWSWQNPYGQPLLGDLVAVAAENRKLRAAPRVGRLEKEIDHLRLALEEQVQREGERLHTAKLEALAEFTAGAGHEINNPLAVISGQAQYLLGHEADWFPGDNQPQVRKALQAIIAQTRRMHSLLRDLMQFARPAPPSCTWVDLPTVMGEVAASLHELAVQRKVRLELHSPLDRFSVHVDADQVRQILASLLRNAVEAAAAEGWARLILRRPVTGREIEVVVEDSGSGPEEAQRPHLFDPFYSGRAAGRGRGMGLPIAWRLARLHGGNVALESTDSSPTRFVFRLPWVGLEPVPARLAS